jgi:membrane-bound lytic murein transglycosylase D
MPTLRFRHFERAAGTIEQRLQVIRESLQGDEDQGDDEPLIGESDLRQDVGIPLVFNDAVEHYITYFTTTKKELFKRWPKRKRRYAPLVKEVLREHGLPEDLVYLAMIESGFNLQAYSPMKAAGPWQLIPETGRRYGLAVNHWVDERRDIRKSTTAAARYLQDLFDRFDS